MIRVEAGDCRAVLATLADPVDAVITDPPYGLQFLGAKWDRGVAFDPATWQAITRGLQPGGWLLAFGAPRTYHRLGCAIEDAGLVIEDQIEWLFGSGYPKARNKLKPAHEPICLAYKPGADRSLGIEDCRVEAPSGVEPNASRCKQGDVSPGYGRGFGRAPRAWNGDGGRWPANVIHDGMNGGSAARFFYCAKAGAEDRWGSKHPTVKPVTLLRYLVRLITPAGGMILDPFAGSGTTGVAALAENRSAILIEQEPGYVEDIRARLAHYEGKGRHSLTVKARHRQPLPGVLL